ncbi:MAG: hypothetical protein MZU79_07020 [Anaerotruncus sp.]|nr:hypothetical protein [Anaerotruncus sp.]
MAGAVTVTLFVLAAPRGAVAMAAAPERQELHPRRAGDLARWDGPFSWRLAGRLREHLALFPVRRHRSRVLVPAVGTRRFRGISSRRDRASSSGSWSPARSRRCSISPWWSSCSGASGPSADVLSLVPHLLHRKG